MPASYGKYYGITLLIIALALGSAYLYFRNAEDVPVPNGNDIPPGTLPPHITPEQPPDNTKPFIPPTGNTFSVKTRDGKNLTIKNFYREAAEVTPYGYVVIEETPDYRFLFFEQDSSFLINIRNSNVHVGRAVAESDLPDLLGISTQQICRLIISVGVSLHVSEKYGGQSYGLSFCSWGKQL